MASASPSASAALVLAVGARPSGQASTSTAASRCTSAACASDEFSLPVSATIAAPWRLTCGVRNTSSSVSPEFDSISTTSSGVIMPRSPCCASAGCTKKAGVPVEASVAASLRAMWPDLPMPDTTTRPRQLSTSATAATKASDRRADRAEIAAASVARTSRASASARDASTAGNAGAAADRVGTSPDIGPV